MNPDPPMAVLTRDGRRVGCDSVHFGELRPPGSGAVAVVFLAGGLREVLPVAAVCEIVPAGSRPDPGPASAAAAAPPRLLTADEAEAAGAAAARRLVARAAG